MKNEDHNDGEIMVLHATQSSPNLNSSRHQNQDYTERDIRLFLKAAAENDVESVKGHLDNGISMEVIFSC